MVSNGAAYGIAVAAWVCAAGLFVGFCFLFPKIADRCCHPQAREGTGEQYKTYGAEV